MNLTYFTSKDILEMETRFRSAFINSLSGFKSASLIGSVDKDGNTNLAIFSSVVHLGSNPALIGFINRPDATSRHTLENISATNCFTINHINETIYKPAHQTSARYPKNISEFDATRLTAEFGKVVKAPYVKESHVKYGLEFVEKHELKINGTILVIGKVVEVFIPENCLLVHGAIAIEKAGTITISGLDSYHTTRQLAQLSYAKPDKMVEELL
ncbi:MAG TPA: flavin reductase [Bacteroidia bacterium]|nr:flavin reductase [Bacteroidia bacterium]